MINYILENTRGIIIVVKELMNNAKGPKSNKNKERGNEVLIEVFVKETPANPYKNLGLIGECMWKWCKYFEWRKKKG